MKKILFVCMLLMTAVFVQAQNASKVTIKNQDTVMEEAPAGSTADEIVDPSFEALSAAAADEDIKTKTTFYKKTVCEKSGKVSWEEVEYCSKSKGFKVVSGKKCSKDKAACAKKCAKSEKKCSKEDKKKCSKDGKKACCKKGTKKASATEK